MSRTTAEALALVNWKGVFYARYGLDRHVTALEGANGAGKTTVMIAAYVVLLPDMSRLRFTNVGETGATGGDKGIWGRLGESGRPSYAVVEFALPESRRLIAGVHLERKGEPSVEPTPFIVSGLDADVRLQDLLLVKQGENEGVPELQELRENAVRLGGRLQSFTSARDYFAALFDQGVTPLRLGTDGERNKLNEMLRTSMTGGISRALTSELRSFLLKEEGGLADTLQRMRANLDACRRTRTEVQEASRLEREIGGVFDAGQTMFEAALMATRERAEELTRRVEEAESARASAADANGSAQEALAQTLNAIDVLERRRGEIGRALESARTWQGRLREALASAKHLAECVVNLTQAEELAKATGVKRDAAESERTAKREALRRAELDYARSAEGLADLQKGLEELHRRADAYRQSTQRLQEAEESLGGLPIPVHTFDNRVAEASSELAGVDDERRHATTLLDDAEAHRTRHTAVMTALQALVARDVPVDEAYETALSVLQEYRARLDRAGRLTSLERDLVEARKQATRQSSVRERANALQVVVGKESAGQLVERLLADAEAELKDHEDRERAAKASAQHVELNLKELESRRRLLADREPVFRALAERAGRLAEHLGIPAVDSRAALDTARTTLGESLAASRKAEDIVREEHEALLMEARDLLAQGGPFASELLKLKDQLGAELVAGSFEDVALDEAGRLEARLGPIAQALVVDDPKATARGLDARPDTLANVLLVSREVDLEQLASGSEPIDVGDRDVAVEDGIALRVSRIPSHPRLGRRAREARAADLNREAERKALELEEVRVSRRHLERLVADGEALLAGHDIWFAGDPAPELAEVRRLYLEAEAQLRIHRTASVRHAEEVRRVRPRVNGLRALLSEALLLDPPDFAERATTLELDLQEARAAKEFVARQRENAELVDRQQTLLRQVPLTEENVVKLRERLQLLTNRRERLKEGIEALEYVKSNVEALAWEDAPARLATEQALVPAIKQQLQEAERHRAAVERESKDADSIFNTALTAFQDADGRRLAATHVRIQAAERFDRLGIPDPSDEALEASEKEVERLDEEHRSYDAKHGELLTTKGRQEGNVTDTARRLQEAEEKLVKERSEAEPAVKRWDELRERAAKFSVIGDLLSEVPKDLADVRGHVNLVQKANTGRALLFERLRVAQGGAQLLAELETLRAPTEGEFAAGVFDLWLAVRDWLRRRLPAQVAEVDDPREALLRLRDQLSALEERLNSQESVLRGASEDVARGIDVQIRKARTQVNRLNKNLEGVSFGSIQGIRVRQNSVEKMEQVLRALRDGAAQTLLFQADLPIEDALDQIFQRFGGGRTGGQKLLDYREYVHLQVEVRRKTGADWEIANPVRLSTGETIGVGAALMMIVLTEWERDAMLLRGKKSHGSLRFLFLDEANRLSHDNLGVLFDLCQALDLQLLIAAPEVARAEGNTTYRLVRKVTADGREEVVVSGRRTRGEA
ncbi:MAG TPA: chromosome partition protein MukB [Steroidobacteraceae bacterium]|nr:chromosome partition protein MukB [Steroidobacteraceae bacterium]